METLHLTIDGMSCGHCVARVSKVLTALPGVKVEKVDVGSADLEYSPSIVSFERIAAALDEAGYPARRSESMA